MVDGDVVLSTDNKIFLKGAQKNHNIISYEKGAVPVKKICLANSIKTDLLGLGTGVGGFSNCATIMYAMRDIFTKDSQKPQYDELTLRIKLVREIVGQEIDRIKGTAAPELPKEWKKFLRINDDDDDAVKADKYRQNSMVISKKPYFFRYLYPELNQRFKQYEDNYNLISRTMFGVKLKKLMAKPNKSEAEMNLIRRYQKYSPLITAPCIMNILCKEIESTDFDIQFDKDGKSVLKSFIQQCDVDEDQVDKVKGLYKQYINKKQVKIVNSILNSDMSLMSDELKEIKFNIMDELKDSLQKQFAEFGLTGEQLLYCCKLISDDCSKFNWDFVWDILGEAVLDVIPDGDSFIPVRTEGGFEYLGQNYTMYDLRDESSRECIDTETKWMFDQMLIDFGYSDEEIKAMHETIENEVSEYNLFDTDITDADDVFDADSEWAYLLGDGEDLFADNDGEDD